MAKKIVFASGKGGVGKSMLCSALAVLFSRDRKITALDCDADAPNLAVWLGDPGNWKESKMISVSEKPVLSGNPSLEKSKECARKCRFGALQVKKGGLSLNPFLCEGCGACEIFCPEGVSGMEPVESACIKIKETKYGFPLVSGSLLAGQTGSGKVVERIKKEALRFGRDLFLADSAPGTGCPVIASMKDADFAVLVTEPTPSGFSDLKKVLEVAKHFNVPWGLVVNKWDINPEMSFEMEKWSGRRLLGRISYDKEIFKTVSDLTPILETGLKAKKEIKKIYGETSKAAKNIL